MKYENVMVGGLSVSDLREWSLSEEMGQDLLRMSKRRVKKKVGGGFEEWLSDEVKESDAK